MKRELLILILLFTFYFLVQSQKYDMNIGDTLTAVSSNASFLSDTTPSGIKRGIKVEFGTIVIANENDFPNIILDNRRGCWLRVLLNNKIGYMFSGYLTKLKFPKQFTNEIHCFDFGQFEDFVRLNVDSLLCKGVSSTNKYGYVDVDYWEIYNDATIIKNSIGMDWTNFVVDSKEISMIDILNVLENYISQLGICKEGEKFTSNSIKIQKELDGSIIKIECTQLNFIALETWQGVYVVANVGEL